MRIPRSLQLFSESGSVHKFWRCHNRAFLLSDFNIKNLYLKCTEYALKHKSIKNKVKLTSFCIMSNHTHMHLDYEDSSEYLSKFMRIAHARFGYAFNKINNSSGKVANERPKTPLIQDAEHSMRVHFYIEANPVRAKIIKLAKLQFSQYSSYGFYAYGRKTKWSHLITIPQWYLDLGKTAKERQAKYRKLFKEYLEEGTKPEKFLKPFIGTLLWVDQSVSFVKKKLITPGLSPPI
jgi:REP element-mobilizing transposase RayT